MRAFPGKSRIMKRTNKQKRETWTQKNWLLTSGQCAPTWVSMDKLLPLPEPQIFSSVKAYLIGHRGELNEIKCIKWVIYLMDIYYIYIYIFFFFFFCPSLVLTGVQIL